MPATGQATVALVVAPGAPLELRDVDLPVLEPGAMLVEVLAATLCGTDISLWHRATAAMPFVAGHEGCGRVIEISGQHRDVTGAPVVVGDRVIFTYPFCGECYYCVVAGQPALCTNALRFGREPLEKFPHLDGSSATHQYVPPRSAVVKVPDSVTNELAASASCALRTIMHGFERLGPVTGNEVAVVQGTGPVGLYCIAVASTRGFGRVLAIGAPAARVALARRFGADDVLDLDAVPDAADRRTWVTERTGGRGADVVLQCASGAAIGEGLALARNGGRFVSIGIGGPDAIPVSTADLSERALTIVGVRSGLGRHFHEAIRFLETASFPFDELITGRYDLSHISDAFAAMQQMTEVKAAIIAN